MTAINQNQPTFAGDDLDIMVSVVRVVNGKTIAKDLTGATAIDYVVMKNPAEGNERVIQKTLGGGIIVTDAERGVFKIAISGNDTAALSGPYFHSGRVTDSAGRTSTVFVGTLSVKQNGM